MRKIWPGKPYPLGATWNGTGVNFAIFSESATGVDLSLYDSPRGEEDAGQVGSMAYRLTGSSDLYGQGGRKPHASINFITTHDGFTLHDLVSYNEKHNLANGEDNRDGHDDNLSWNCGAEGATKDEPIVTLRERQKRNFLATLLLSQGVPMLVAGDEFGRTQRGNNNAYCQDNEISWIDWSLAAANKHSLEFTRQLIRLFRAHPMLRRRKFFQGRRIRGSEVKDLSWFCPDGKEMTEAGLKYCWINVDRWRATRLGAARRDTAKNRQ